MSRPAAGILAAIALTSCAGGGGSPTTQPSPPPPMQGPASARPALGIGDDVGMRARLPTAWYAQPYSTESLLVTSFPVHVNDGRVWRETPPGGTAIEIIDYPGESLAACRRAAGHHGHLRLRHHEPDYEGFGAAYRIQFHERGHAVLVFVSFGGRRPTAEQRRLAVAVLNSIHVERRACPVSLEHPRGKHLSP